MKKVILTLACVFVLFGYIHSQEITELSPQEAYEMAKKPSSYLIDIRSIAEYVFVEHPEMAYNRKVYNLTQGFEGGKDENGYRTVGGWKNSGVPYTYNLDEKLVYKFK